MIKTKNAILTIKHLLHSLYSQKRNPAKLAQQIADIKGAISSIDQTINTLNNPVKPNEYIHRQLLINDRDNLKKIEDMDIAALNRLLLQQKEHINHARQMQHKPKAITKVLGKFVNKKPTSKSIAQNKDKELLDSQLLLKQILQQQANYPLLSKQIAHELNIVNQVIAKSLQELDTYLNEFSNNFTTATNIQNNSEKHQEFILSEFEHNDSNIPVSANGIVGNTIKEGYENIALRRLKSLENSSALVNNHSELISIKNNLQNMQNSIFAQLADETPLNITVLSTTLTKCDSSLSLAKEKLEDCKAFSRIAPSTPAVKSSKSFISKVAAGLQRVRQSFSSLSALLGTSPKIENGTSEQEDETSKQNNFALFTKQSKLLESMQSGIRTEISNLGKLGFNSNEPSV